MSLQFKSVILVCLTALSSVGNAQDLLMQSSASVGAARIMSVSAVDYLQTVNPSMNTFAKSLDIHISYTLPYHIKDLQQINAKAAYSMPWATLHTNVGKSGSNESSYTIVGGGLSRSFGFFSIGMEYNAVIHHLPYNETHVSSFSRIGFHTVPNNKWTLSVAVHNIEKRGFSYEQYDFDIEPYFFAGAKWKGNDIFTLMCEVEKGWEHDPTYKVAMAVVPCRWLTTSIGFSTLGHSLTAGIGYINKLMTIHVGINHDEKLGVTSAASLTLHNIFRQ